MTVSLKSDASGTFGEILLNGSPVARIVSTGLDTVAGAEYFHQANIVGSVSESGGTPTGAIIEKGSNANGQFVKFADGTMICYRDNVSLSGVAINVAAQQAPFRSNGTALTFPATFVSGQITSLAVAHNTNVEAFVAGVNSSTTQITIILGRQTSSASVTQAVSYIAIGRWF